MNGNRYRYSQQFIQTNFTLDHCTESETPVKSSTYCDDFNSPSTGRRFRGAISQPGNLGDQTVQKASLPHLQSVDSVSEKPSVASRLEGEQRLKEKEEWQKRKSALQKTNFSFGNERMASLTEYREFTMATGKVPPTQPCPAPTDSQVNIQ